MNIIYTKKNYFVINVEKFDRNLKNKWIKI